MKQRLKTHQLILLAILLVLLIACGAAYAYMFMRDDGNSTKFVPANVVCKVLKEESGSTITSIKVWSDKDSGSNIPAYIRVRLVTYWVDSKGDIVAKPSPSLDFTPASGWMKSSGSNTYSYATPIDPDAQTSELLLAPISQQVDGEYKQIIDVFAEAIQADPGDAVEEAWGVTLTGSTITAVPVG